MPTIPPRAATLWLSARPPFLLLSLACVFLGASAALAAGAPLDPATLALTLLGALAAHVAVNCHNEYLDFASGLDLRTARTPFSGGSGALPAAPQLASAVLRLSRVSLALTLLVGVWAIATRGWGMAPLGLAGVALILSYTGPINRRPWLCLIAPGAGFGLLMVSGSSYLLAGQHLASAWLAALLAFFLVNNLLLLNQFPDTDADRSVGRRHFVIAYGARRASDAYAVSLAACALLLALAAVVGTLPPTALLGLPPLLLGVIAWRGARRHGEGLGGQPHFLAANVAATLLTPTLLGVGLLLAVA